mgnify:CR=1 FL=1
MSISALAGSLFAYFSPLLICADCFYVLPRSLWLAADRQASFHACWHVAMKQLTRSCRWLTQRLMEPLCMLLVGSLACVVCLIRWLRLCLLWLAATQAFVQAPVLLEHV